MERLWVISIEVPRAVGESVSITNVTAFSTLSNFRSLPPNFLLPSAGFLISCEYQNTVAASVMIPSPPQAVVSFRRWLRADRPIPSQGLGQVAMGRRLLEAIGAAASMNANSDCDSGDFGDGGLRPAGSRRRGFQNLNNLGNPARPLLVFL